LKIIAPLRKYNIFPVRNVNISSLYDFKIRKIGTNFLLVESKGSSIVENTATVKSKKSKAIPVTGREGP
jgi:hypothetical protein